MAGIDNSIVFEILKSLSGYKPVEIKRDLLFEFIELPEKQNASAVRFIGATKTGSLVWWPNSNKWINYISDFDVNYGTAYLQKLNFFLNEQKFPGDDPLQYTFESHLYSIFCTYTQMVKNGKALDNIKSCCRTNGVPQNEIQAICSGTLDEAICSIIRSAKSKPKKEKQQYTQMYLNKNIHLKKKEKLEIDKTLLQLLQPDYIHYNMTESYSQRYGIEQEYKNWKNSSEKILLFVGSPGCGKTSFITFLNDSKYISGVFYLRFQQSDVSLKELMCNTAYIIAMSSMAYQTSLIEELKKANLYHSENFTHIKNDRKQILCLESNELFSLLFHSIQDNEQMFTEPIVLGFDGIDEIPSLFQSALTSGLFYLPNIRFIISTRNDQEILEKISIFYPYYVNIDQMDNTGEITQYIKRRLSKKEIKPNDIDALTHNAAGNFSYASLICSAYLSGQYDIRTHTLPKNILDLYYSWFNRLFSKDRDTFYPILSLLVLDIEFTQKDVSEILNWNERDICHFIDCMKGFVIIENEYIRFFHKSVRDWLIGSSGSGRLFCSKDEGEKLFYSYSINAIRDTDNISYRMQRLIYSFAQRFLSPSLRKNIVGNLHFLERLQYNAYKFSDFQLFIQLTEAITFAYNNILSANQKKEYVHYLASSIINYAEYHFMLFEWTKAKEIINKAVDTYPQAFELENDPELYAIMKMDLAWIERNLGNVPKALFDIEYLINSLSGVVFHDRERHMANIYYNKAHSLYASKQYGEAIRCLEIACSFAAYSSIQTECNSLYHTLMGLCYSRKKEYSEAIELLKLSLEEKISVYGKENYYVAQSLDSLCKVDLYAMRDNGTSMMPETKENAHLALRINQKLFGQNSVRTAYSNLTVSFVESVLLNKAQAIKHIQDAISAFAENNLTTEFKHAQFLLEKIKSDANILEYV